MTLRSVRVLMAWLVVPGVGVPHLAVPTLPAFPDDDQTLQQKRDNQMSYQKGADWGIIAKLGRN